MQKYIAPTISRFSEIPPTLAILTGGSSAGIVLQFLICMTPFQLLPIAFVSVGICIASYWNTHLRLIGVIVGAVMIGMLTASRVTFSLPVSSVRPYTQVAWFDGEVVDVLTQRDRTVRCIVEGVLDPKYLPPRNGLRILLTAKFSSPVIIGRHIVGTIAVRLPRQRVFPTDYSEWQYCAARRISLVGAIIGGNVALTTRSDDNSSVVQTCCIVARRLTEQLFTDQATRTLVRAMVLGDREELSTQTSQLFSQTGTAHVLSVSGFHVGVIAAIIFIITSSIPQHWIRYAVVAAAIWCYVLIAGASPPAVRAGLAASLGLGILALQRWMAPLQAVVTTLWIMLIVDPSLVFSLSFQLSAAGVIGIVVIGMRLYHQIHVRRESSAVFRWILALVAITIGATILTAPLCAYYFGYVPVVSLFANMFVVPVATLLIVTSVITLGTGAVSIELGRFYASLCEGFASVMIRIVDFAASWQWFISGPELVWVSSTAVVAAWYIVRARSRRLFLFRFLACAVLLIGWWQMCHWHYLTPRQTHYQRDGVRVTVRRISPDVVAVQVRGTPPRIDRHRFAAALTTYCRSLPVTRLYLVAYTPEEMRLLQNIAHHVSHAIAITDTN